MVVFTVLLMLIWVLVCLHLKHLLTDRWYCGYVAYDAVAIISVRQSKWADRNTKPE
jgi:low temperature requirement protein LtrA